MDGAVLGSCSEGELGATRKDVARTPDINAGARTVPPQTCITHCFGRSVWHYIEDYKKWMCARSFLCTLNTHFFFFRASSNNLAKEEKETEGQAPEDIYPYPSVEKRVRAAKRRKDENGKGSRFIRKKNTFAASPTDT